MVAFVSRVGISSMEVQDHQPNLEGWRRDLVPLREPAEGVKAQRTLKKQVLIGTIVFVLVVVTPAGLPCAAGSACALLSGSLANEILRRIYAQGSLVYSSG